MLTDLLEGSVTREGVLLPRLYRPSVLPFGRASLEATIPL